MLRALVALLIFRTAHAQILPWVDAFNNNNKKKEAKITYSDKTVCCGGNENNQVKRKTKGYNKRKQN